MANSSDELLVYQREHHGDPYMTLAKAKEMQRVALQFWHLKAAKKKADRDAQEEAAVAFMTSCFRPTPLSLTGPWGEAIRLDSGDGSPDCWNVFFAGDGVAGQLPFNRSRIRH